MDPLESLFTSNAPLQALETASVEGEIATRMAAIRKLELEVKKYQALLSPLRELPAEVLGEIFIAVVSNTWRTTALSTPQLWNTVGLDLDTRDPIDFVKVKNWLARSGTTPRSLTLYSGRACAGHEDGCVLVVEGLVDFLKSGPSIDRLTMMSETSECFQWLSLELMTPNNAPPPSWTSIKTIELNTSELGLGPHFVAGEGQPGPHLIPTTLNLDGPFLQDDAQAANGSAYIQTMLGNLTNLAFTFVWPTTWDQGTLPLCKNLHTLLLKMDFELSWADQHWWDATSFQREGGHLTFPNLCILRIHELPVNVGWNLNILRLFVTPTLAELDIQFEDDDFDPDDRFRLGDEIWSLIKRSRCEETFHRLRLAEITISEERLDHVLSRLPWVTHLTLDRIGVDSTFFRRNTVVDNILPRLEILELFHMYESFGYQDVCGFASSRANRCVAPGSSKFRKLVVELSSRWGQHPDDTWDAKNLREEGIDAHIIIGAHL